MIRSSALRHNCSSCSGLKSLHTDASIVLQAFQPLYHENKILNLYAIFKVQLTAFTSQLSSETDVYELNLLEKVIV